MFVPKPMEILVVNLNALRSSTVVSPPRKIRVSINGWLINCRNYLPQYLIWIGRLIKNSDALPEKTFIYLFDLCSDSSLLLDLSESHFKSALLPPFFST